MRPSLVCSLCNKLFFPFFLLGKCLLRVIIAFHLESAEAQKILRPAHGCGQETYISHTLSLTRFLSCALNCWFLAWGREDQFIWNILERAVEQRSQFKLRWIRWNFNTHTVTFHTRANWLHSFLRKIKLGRLTLLGLVGGKIPQTSVTDTDEVWKKEFISVDYWLLAGWRGPLGCSEVQRHRARLSSRSMMGVSTMSKLPISPLTFVG